MFNFKQPDLNFAEQYEAKRFCQFEGAAPLIGAGTSLLGGIMGSDSASAAADAQVKAAQIAADTQMKMYEQNRSDLGPYRDIGAGALSLISGQYGLPTSDYTNDKGLTIPGMGPGANQDFYKTQPSTESVLAPWLQGMQPYADATTNIMNQFTGPGGPTAAFAGFKQSPGYSWARDEAMRTGLQALNTGGGGGGGGRIQALTDRSAGMASQDYQNYVNNLLSGSSTALSAAGRGSDIMAKGGGLALSGQQLSGNLYNDYFNRLASMAGIGQAGTSKTADLGQKAATEIGNYQASQGISQAAGITSGTNALSRGFQNAGAYAGNYLDTSGGGANSPFSSSYSNADLAGTAGSYFDMAGGAGY